MAKHNFWSDVPNTSLFCKCGAKASVHGYCNEHWEKEGKNKHLNKFIEEAQKMKSARKKVDDLIFDKKFEEAKKFLTYEYPKM